MAPRQKGKELRHFRRALPLALAFVLAMSAVAFGDTIQVNDLVTGGDATKNPDATGTIQVFLIAQNGSGGNAQHPGDINGCNAGGIGSGQAVRVHLTSNDTGKVTVASPGYVDLEVCDNPATPGTREGAKTIGYTVASGASAGAVTINGVASGGKPNSLFNNDSMTVTIEVSAPSNTAPTVSVTGVSDGASYEIGSVPAASCSVVDTQDGNSSFAATLSAITGSLSAYGLGSQTASCSYTDSGGLSDSASATYSIVDTGDPTIDDLGPTALPDGDNGWYVSPVTNTFRASDSGAGFAGETNPYEFTKNSGSSEGSAVTIASGAVVDVAGNSASSIDSEAFMIDLSDPYNVSFVGGPAAGSSHYFGSVPAPPTCTADDDISGLASCVVTGHNTAVGTHTMTATAKDNAGRTKQVTRQYTVLAWTIAGFYQPVDMGKLNTAKAGSTIPLKFRVFAGSTELTDTSIVKTFTQKMSCSDMSAVTDAIEEYATGNTSLRYDSTGGQFIFNWKTPTTKACYRVTLETQDGSKITADFQLR